MRPGTLFVATMLAAVLALPACKRQREWKGLNVTKEDLGKTRQAANIDIAKDDNAYQKLGLEHPTSEGTSVLKVNDDVALIRKVAYGTLKFSAVVPGYSERS